MKAYFERAGVSGIRTSRWLGDAPPRSPGSFRTQREVV